MALEKIETREQLKQIMIYAGRPGLGMIGKSFRLRLGLPDGRRSKSSKEAQASLRGGGNYVHVNCYSLRFSCYCSSDLASSREL